MPSFDTVLEADFVEVKNAVDQVAREVGTRFDFKGTSAGIELKDKEITLFGDAEFQLQQVEEVLRTRPGVDAVFFCNDDLAQGGLLAAQRLGLDVPGRVAIAGFNDLAGSDQMLPPLTTVRTPRSAIGEASAQMLLTLMRGEMPEKNSVNLGFELTVRAST